MELKEGELWHTLPETEVVKKFQSNKDGLTEKEAAKRLKEYGENEIKKTKKISTIGIFLSQFNSFFIYILLFAAILTLVLHETVDFYVIIAVVLINTSLGFFQQYKAEKGLEKLKQIFQQTVKVLRDGILIKTDYKSLVPGDIISFESGDRIMADARIIECENLHINEAVLTGESMRAHKTAETIKNSVAIADRVNMVYAGTTVIFGYGRAVVVSTGMDTEFGRIARNVQEIQSPKTPLQIKLESFSKKLGVVILSLCAIFMIGGFLLGIDKLEMLLTSLTLAVAAVPEGLPIVITIALGLTVYRMVKVKTLIRKLPAAESLGAITIICSDKTGTITSEEMQVTRVLCNNNMLDVKEEKIKDGIEKTEVQFYLGKKIIESVENKELMQILKIGILCNNARFEKKDDIEYVLGDPTEKALLLTAMGAGLNKAALTKENKRVKEFSFTSKRKIMSIVREKDGVMTSYVKGSPEIILEKCVKELRDGREILLTDRRRKELKIIYEYMASSALRVLGFAYKEVKKSDIDTAEESLIFVGFQGIFDSPRPEVKDAILKCREAGIKVKMITGDNALTAKAVANMIGLKGKIVSGHELKLMTDKELSTKIDGISIFARIDPEDKVRVVSMLRSKGEIVAVTGDGVNDAPALKQADIGIAMGIRGTDVTREVAEIILLDDNFSSIVKAVEEGRRTEDNIRNSIMFMLTLNFAELFIIFISLFARLPLPLLPLQILLLNLITDSIPSLAIGVEPADKEIMKRAPRDPKASVLGNSSKYVVIGSLFSTFIILNMYLFLLSLGKIESIEKTRTIILTTMIMFQLFIVFSFRSKKNISEIGLFTNKSLIYAVLLSVAIQLALLYTSLNKFFTLVPLTIYDWFYIIPISLSGLFVAELFKVIRKKKINTNKAK